MDVLAAILKQSMLLLQFECSLPSPASCAKGLVINDGVAVCGGSFKRKDLVEGT